MTPDDFAVLDLARFEVRLRARQRTSLPPFLGSMVRGAFGASLKSVACVRDQRTCAQTCAEPAACPYSQVFETPPPEDSAALRGQQQAPHPFVLVHPPLAGPADGRHLAPGDEIAFGFILLGPAIDHTHAVAAAFWDASRHGLGARRDPFDLVEFKSLDGDDPDGRPTSQAGPPRRRLDSLVRARIDGARGDDIGLKFLTPARIRVDGDLQTGLTFELLIRNLLRRISMLAAIHGSRPVDLDYRAIIARATSVRASSSRLRWREIDRYSNRQRTKMKLGGFLGDVRFSGESVHEFLPLLAAGELLQVGAATSFGLGRYVVDLVSDVT